MGHSSDPVNHVLDVETSSSPAASQPNAPEITESETATRPSSSSDEVQGNGEPPLPSEGKLSGRVRQRIDSWRNRHREPISLDSKAIKGAPYTDIQLLWYRKKKAWPARDVTVTWPPEDEKELEELVGLADEFWSSEQKDRVKRLDSLNADASSGRNEQYQLGGLYAVFLSVFFSSASQTNNLKCEDWPILVILTLIVTGCTLVIFIQKSCLTHALQGKITRLNDKHKHIESQLKELRQLGPSFGFKSTDISTNTSLRFDFDKFFGIIAIIFFTAFMCSGIYYVLCRPGETPENKRLSTWALLGL